MGDRKCAVLETFKVHLDKREEKNGAPKPLWLVGFLKKYFRASRTSQNTKKLHLNPKRHHQNPFGTISAIFFINIPLQIHFTTKFNKKSGNPIPNIEIVPRIAYLFNKSFIKEMAKGNKNRKFLFHE